VGPAADALLLPWVFGYRPGCSVDGALAYLVRRVGEHPHLELLHADVESLFDSLEHGFLTRCLAGFSVDPLWCRMNALWQHCWAASPGHGVPQGAPLSPLLANLYLRKALDLHLEEAMRGSTPGAPPVVACIRYGDDLALASDAPGGAFAALRWVEGILTRAGLRLSAGKTTAALSGMAAVPVVLLGQPLSLRHGPAGWRLERSAGPFPTQSR
jgi:CRISPR-associated protein Cas1